MPGSGRPIEPGRISIAAKLAIMIPPVSVCHQLSWIGRPNASMPHTTASGLSGSPTLATKRSADERPPTHRLRAALHHHAHRGRRVYQTVTLLAGQDAVPALGVELGLVDDERHAERQRRDDAVGRAGHPAGVGRAPEDVVGMQVERERAVA